MQNIIIQAAQNEKWEQTRSGDLLTKKGSQALLLFDNSISKKGIQPGK